MSLILTNNSENSVPICVRGVLPDVIADSKPTAIAKLKIWRGNRNLCVGDLFDIEQVDDEQGNLVVWRGDMSRVHWLGAGMTSGCMTVEGNAGWHVGSQMTGGQIDVQGNACTYVGCEMTGGKITIKGSAGDWLGAAYPGSKFGANRGTILVGGDAGLGVGYRLRRGLICIAGSVERLVGWNMLAGTIAIGNAVGPMPGKGMVRGTLLLASSTAHHGIRDLLPPSYSVGAKSENTIVGAIGRWLDNLKSGIDVPNSAFQTFHGDHLKGGRGEVLVADQV